MSLKIWKRKKNYPRKCQGCFCYTESVWKRKCWSCGSKLPPVKWHRKLPWLEKIKQWFGIYK